MTRCVITIAAFLFVVTFVCAAELTPPPKPPEGWETRVLAGFLPPLESVLAEPTFVPPDKIKKNWGAWGPGAVDGFLKLYHDPAWEKFRSKILGLLFTSPYPEARARLEQEVRKAAAENNPDSDYSLHHFIRVFAQYYPKDSMPLLQELAKSSNLDVRDAAGCTLASLATPESVAAAKNVAESLPENKRMSVKYSIDAAEGTLRSKEIMIK
jgi:hypothetical protein